MEGLFLDEESRMSESDSDIESDNDLTEPIIGNWLDDDDEDQSQSTVPAEKATSDEGHQYQPHLARPATLESDVARPTHPSLVSRLDLFYSLCHVEDLDFARKSEELQVALMDTLELETFSAGENVFKYGDSSTDLFFIVSADELVESTRVAVVGRSSEGKEVLLTYLFRGQYFGQMFFLTKQPRVRSATIRVPLLTGSEVPSPPVVLAKLKARHFDEWESFRKVLITKTVPLIQWLPKDRRMELLSQMQTEHFNTDEYIIKQGGVGDKFYIVLNGSARVIDETQAPNRESGGIKRAAKLLVTLREGHCFGELALVTNGLRVASVVANCATTCLSMSKSVFQNALSADTFSAVVKELVKMHSKTRMTRQLADEKKSSAKLQPQHSAPATASKLTAVAVVATVNDAVITHALSVRKVNTGHGHQKIINEKYVILHEIGRGSFGEVFLCRELATDELFAMKAIQRSTHANLHESQHSAHAAGTPSSLSSGFNSLITNDSHHGVASNEIEVMKSLRHRNIVSLHEVIDDPHARKVYLIQEYMDGGVVMPDQELAEPLPINFARRCFRDLIRGVSYLHNEGVIHRDLKPVNMMLHKDVGGSVLKICDFGAAAFMNNSPSHEHVHSHSPHSFYAGTPAFMAPELFLSKSDRSDIEFSRMPSTDVFAMGATLYFMVVGHPPWMANSQLDLAAKIRGLEPTLPSGIDPHLRYLLLRMLDKDYAGRITLPELLEDAWVTQEGSEPLVLNEPEPDDSEDTSEDYFRFLNTPMKDRLSLSPTSEESSRGLLSLSTTQDDDSVFLDSLSSINTQQTSPDGAIQSIDSVKLLGLSRTLNRTKEFYFSPALEDHFDGGVFSVLAKAPGTLIDRYFPTVNNGLTILGTDSELQEVALRRRRRQKALGASRLYSQLRVKEGDGTGDASSFLGGWVESRFQISSASGNSASFNSTRSKKSASSLASNNTSTTAKGLGAPTTTKTVSDDGEDETDDSASTGSSDTDYDEELLEASEFDELMDQLGKSRKDSKSTTALWNCIIPCSATSTTFAALPEKSSGGFFKRPSLRGPTTALLSSEHFDSSPRIPSDGIVLEVTGRRRRMSNTKKAEPSFLSRSIAPPNATNLSLGVRFAVADSIGSRQYMEDRSCCEANLRLEHNGESVHETAALFGVFDGHGGTATADSLRSALPRLVASYFGRILSPPTSDAFLANGILREDFELQLSTIFASLDYALLRAHKASAKARKANLLQQAPGETSGATAAVVVVVRLLETKHVVVANAGDCRVVLSLVGVAHALTEDHKPSLASETRRIEAAGGTVCNGRVGGVLGVSRCFGDWQYKLCKDDEEKLNLMLGRDGQNNDEEPLLSIADQEEVWSSRRQVVSRPGTTSFEISDLDEFLIVASDGLWDVLSSQEAVNFVRWQLHEHADIDRATKLLVEEAVSRSAADNITAVVCCLNQLEREERP